MNGLVLHAKYCFMPNRLGGCGIQNKTKDLFDYASSDTGDKGLEEILKTFEAAYPYIRFIARETGIEDPFDRRVVEAYWLGNDLLNKIDKKRFYDWCYEGYKKKTSKKVMEILVGKVPMGALPHHSFHVFNSYLRTSDYKGVVEFMNECRIVAGRVIEIKSSHILVEAKDIQLGVRGFYFSKKKRKVSNKIEGKTFVSDLSEGDFVTIHWNWVCEKITKKQASFLEKISLRQLQLFNSDL